MEEYTSVSHILTVVKWWTGWLKGQFPVQPMHGLTSCCSCTILIAYVLFVVFNDLCCCCIPELVFTVIVCPSTWRTLLHAALVAVNKGLRVSV